MSILIKGKYTIEDAWIIPIINQSKCLPEMSFNQKQKLNMEVSAYKIVIKYKKQNKKHTV